MFDKIKNYVMLSLIVLFFGVFVYYNIKISSLEKKLNQTTPMVDTVIVTLTIHDTTVVTRADTVSTEIEKRGDSVFVYKNMHTTFEQPLFNLDVWAFSRREEFKFDIKYRPLKIYLLFKNFRDLRQGFQLYTKPSIGKVEIDWGNYIPVKIKKLSFDISLGYSKGLGPCLMGGFNYKRLGIGTFLFQDFYGFYIRRSL